MCSAEIEKLRYAMCTRLESRSSLIGEGLQLIWAQAVLVQQDVVVHRPAGALDGGVRVQIEVILRGVHNSLVHHRACIHHKQLQHSLC